MMNKDLGLIVWLLSVSVWAFAQTTGSPCATDCVYPGDANNDHVVDKSDVLAIGLTYGFTGAPRQNASTDWHPQSCATWTDNIPGTAVDSKYADCTGNGTVSLSDFNTVFFNWSNTHRSPHPQNGGHRPTTGLEVRIKFDEDSLEVEHNSHQTYPFDAEIWVGNASLQAAALYGFALTINYDANFLGNAPLFVEYNSSWFGTNGMSGVTKLFANDNRGAGQLDIAVTRLNHQSTSGFGRVATIHGGVIGENINGRNFRRFLHFDVVDVQGVNASGIPQTMFGVSDSLLISQTITTATSKTTSEIDFILSPNPVSAAQNLTIIGFNTAFDYTISDKLGRIIRTERSNTAQTISIADLTQGFYLITVTTEHGTLTKPFIVK